MINESGLLFAAYSRFAVLDAEMLSHTERGTIGVFAANVTTFSLDGTNLMTRVVADGGDTIFAPSEGLTLQSAFDYVCEHCAGHHDDELLTEVARLIEGGVSPKKLDAMER
ncbi:hypothetical protein ACFX59_02285 [Sphingomonas sp. NCPPB 2930]|uniref:hypothetical protein n=1 Tax=Sphingomonas sp. NCPPB 2930 TaxID=3162788 RepID=UPI0036DCC30F